MEHPVIASAIAHHRLVSIHPFMDGNGRIARALGAWLLYCRGFDTHHIFALDEFFDSDRDRYYYEIQKVRDNEDNLSSWLEYFGEGIVSTLERTKQRIQTLRAGSPADKIILTRIQERILRILGEESKIGGGELARMLDMSRSHLSKTLGPMIRAGLVIKEGSTKASIYRLPSANREMK